jgi:hypothetical protein
MNKKLIKYWVIDGIWICYSEKLNNYGYGKTKKESLKMFLEQWDYLKTEYKENKKK